MDLSHNLFWVITKNVRRGLIEDENISLQIVSNYAIHTRLHQLAAQHFLRNSEGVKNRGYPGYAH